MNRFEASLLPSQRIYPYSVISNFSHLCTHTWKNDTLMEVKNFYIQNPYPYVGNHNSVFERDYYEYIKKLNPKKILDAGCGTGVFSEAFSRLFPTSVIDAVDFSSEAITLAKKRLTNKKTLNSIPLI